MTLHHSMASLQRTGTSQAISKSSTIKLSAIKFIDLESNSRLSIASALVSMRLLTGHGNMLFYHSTVKGNKKYIQQR